MALVNGVPIRFAIDTGAAITVLRAEDAAKAGFALRTADFRGRLQGVAATAPVAEVTIDRLTLGEIDIRNIRADVEDGALDVSLLGQNFISKIDRVIIEKGVMTLQGAPDAAAIRIEPVKVE